MHVKVNVDKLLGLQRQNAEGTEGWFAHLKYCPDSIKKSTEPVGFLVQDKLMSPHADLRKSSSSCMISGRTAIKLLIAQEMFKEKDSQLNPPGVVAKLMGLDSMPTQHPLKPTDKSWQVSWTEDDEHFERCCFSRPLPSGVQLSNEKQEHNHVYEDLKQPSIKNHIKESLSQKLRLVDSSDKKRMALVREKFNEAKRLAMDEKLMQSKEFEDALEFLSSNKELFLNFLDESHSLFSRHSSELHSTSSPTQTRRITVLQPSKSASLRGEKHIKPQLHPSAEETSPNAGGFRSPKNEYSTHPTRIVVLKPRLGKPYGGGSSVTTPTSSSSMLVDERDISNSHLTCNSIGSREMGQDMSRNIVENPSCRRDDSILSSVLSNGYIGDESSFNRSESDYADMVDSNFRGLDIVSPSSRQSCGHAGRYVGIPYSMSAFTSASCSLELSVIKEAKMRLSERIASVNQDMEHPTWNSITLGEMLSMRVIKKEEGSENDKAVRSSGSYGSRECDENSPRNLSRSKSLPVSSSTSETVGQKVEVQGSLVGKPRYSNQIEKAKSRKSSWSLPFFSKSKKSEKVVSHPDHEEDSVLKSALAEDIHDCSHSGNSSRPSRRKSGSSLSLPTTASELRHYTVSSKAALMPDKTCSSENSSDNLERPSPVSVLSAPFLDDANSGSRESSSQNIHHGHLQSLSRSPPIGSLARSLPWDGEIRRRTPSPHPWKLSVSHVKVQKEEEEQEMFLFVHKLLSSAGMEEEINGCCAPSKWHSQDCPLDPVMLQEFMEFYNGEGARCAERRSHQRLIFDSVNAALLEIVGSSRDGTVLQGVWRLIKGWLTGSSGQLLLNEASGGGDALAGAVRRELVGGEWKESMLPAAEEIVEEIAREVLETVIGEALEELTAGLCILSVRFLSCAPSVSLGLP